MTEDELFAFALLFQTAELLEPFACSLGLDEAAFLLAHLSMLLYKQ